MQDAINQVLATFQGSVIEAAQDVEQSIEALDGKYVCEIGKVNNKEWDDGSSSLSFSLKVVENVTGTKANGRYVQKRFSIGKTKFGEADENMATLLKGLKTMGLIEGVTAETTMDGILSTCLASSGKLVNAKITPMKKKGVVQEDDNGWPKHKVQIVEKFDIADPLSSGGEAVDNTIGTTSTAADVTPF